MSIVWLENLMYQLSDFFLAPVLILLVVLFAYSLFALGRFTTQALQRRRYRVDYQGLAERGLSAQLSASFNGYPLVAAARADTNISQDELDVLALGELEGVRTVSRLAPMLGLIATMVPMGPALKSLANGNVQGISENLIVAFSAVIFGLVIASITFWIASVKKRWLAGELVMISRQRSEQGIMTLGEAVDEAT
ncbi:MAG: MotA/TolQ/ExbB proton channel family protein [Cellvibrionaceae bacterium]|nr:MotA/TolQ/ExbB proton channel family protein [Cellvibrionaceae bacterium]MCV6626087.1 MotA/TolQ/ExbB proton channel family protein [Cellvibrionaceae bacterium]